MANLYDYVKNPKKKGGFPRKSDRELENFFPDTMKTASHSYWDNKPSDGNQYNLYDSNTSSTYSYKDSASFYGSERKNRGRRECNDHRLYDERNPNSFKYTQPKERDLSSGTLLKHDPSKRKKVERVETPISISSETFQTVSNSPRMSKTVLSRQDKHHDERKPKERITILPPNGLSMSTPPVILSRSKVEPTAIRSNQRNGSPSIIQKSAVSVPYKIASKPPVPSGPNIKVVPEKQMNRVFRLMDDHFNLCEGHTAFNAFLLDQTHFLVVGVVGRQGVGKSTLASLIAGVQHNSTPFPNASGSALSLRNTSTGLDLLVTSQRVIVLDFPALMAPGIMDTTGRDKHSAAPKVSQSIPLEMQVYSKTLQFLSLALRSCHVVVVVEDSPSHASESLRCMQTATLLHHRYHSLVNHQFYENPESPRSPTVLVVHNKATDGGHRDFKVQVSRGVGGSSVQFRTGLGDDQQHGVNVFTVPRLPKKASGNECPEIVKLRRALTAVTRRQFGSVVCTERTWFEYMVREWEKIRKSRLYLDCSRLFP